MKNIWKKEKSEDKKQSVIMIKIRERWSKWWKWEWEDDKGLDQLKR